MVALSGTVQDLVGNYFPDFTLVAKATLPFYTGNVLTTTAPVNMPALSGSVTGSFPETETTNVLVDFSAHYTADGIYQEIQFIPVIIPNVASIELSQLLFPILS